MARYVGRENVRKRLEPLAGQPGRTVYAGGTARIETADETITVRPQGRFKADNGVAIAAAALAGLGIAALPDFLIDAHIASRASGAVAWVRMRPCAS